MYKDILLPVDLNQQGSWSEALPAALEYCKAFGSNLHVMTVLPNFGMPMVGSFFPEGFIEKAIEEGKKHLDDFIAEHIAAKIKVQHILVVGNVYEEILKRAEEVNADLIIMAAYRPDLKDYLLGPNSEKVMRHSSRSVLVVRK